MAEAQGAGVQAEPFGGIGLCAILLVANDRASGIRKMHPDLMSSASFEG
jgi:hypothetical protein